MKCPKCDVNLTMSERQNIEIDYCPVCRGVWLDRGELDKIIERSAEVERASASRRGARDDEDDDDRRYRHPAPPPPPQQHPQDHGSPYRYKKRKSWLEELFD